MRRRLPDRRPSETIGMGHYTITVGYDPETGDPMEVFADDPHAGSDRQWLIADICTIISRALQTGMTLAELSDSLGTQPRNENGVLVSRPASPVGEILAQMQAGRGE